MIAAVMNEVGTMRIVGQVELVVNGGLCEGLGFRPVNSRCGRQ